MLLETHKGFSPLTELAFRIGYYNCRLKGRGIIRGGRVTKKEEVSN